MKNRTKQTEQTVGFAWYTAQEWEALRRVSADKGSLHTSYAEWEADAQEQLRSLQQTDESSIRYSEGGLYPYHRCVSGFVWWPVSA